MIVNPVATGSVLPGTGASLAPRSPDAGRPFPLARRRDVPYVPTAEPVVEALLDFAGVGPADVVYDLGCGDGRVVIAAARRGARGMGVDIDRLRIRECEWNTQRAGPGVAGRVRFVRGSLFDVDLREATVLTLYLMPSINRRLRPRILREMAAGTRVVSNYFDMGDWKPDAIVERHKRVLLLWKVPACVEGRWSCVAMQPDGARRRMVLSLKRRYQMLAGTARMGPYEIPIHDGRVDGKQIMFELPRRGDITGGRYEATLEGNCLRGTFHADGTRATPWFGARTGP
ncbi:MAG TPA: class I SAM-dependent methyltransferase [Tepidisphaeraceae bacterium]|nr:class I SAM-dependent methyltransferase [Tepidisphaeraceae bacterium]